MNADKAVVAVRVAVDRFLASARCRNLTTRRSYGGTLDRIAEQLGAGRPLREVTGDELGQTLAQMWGNAAASTWNQRRAAVSSFLAWCAKNGYPAPVLPAGVERQPEQRDETRSVDRAAVERLLTRRDIPLREKTLWRMLYETAARANEILGLNIEDLELDARRARILAKGGATEYVYWASGTAHLLPRLIRGREAGPVFLSERRRAPPAVPIPRTCARTPAGPASVTTGRACSWTAIPRPARTNPAGICTNCATPQPLTSARPTPVSN